MSKVGSNSIDEARLASLKRLTQDSRSLFDTFLLHSDHLLRFTDDLLRRADEIHFPPAPVISVHPHSAADTRNEKAVAIEPKRPQEKKAGARRILPPVPRPMTTAISQPPAAVRPPAAAPPPAPQRTRSASQHSAPVVVVIGPVDRMGEIEDLTIDLETVPEIDVHFRLFRAGAYRIDASCSDIDGFTDRLRTRKDVLSVDRHGATVHILPAPATL